MNNPSFRLLEIQFERHEVLKDLKLTFIDETNIERGPYSTLIIGINGSGKSHVLRAIIEVLRELENLQKTGKLKYLVRGGFFVKYRIDGAVFEVNTIKMAQQTGATSQRSYLRNGEAISHDHLQLPKSVIANSIMLNDRFPVIKENESNVYFYQGIRRTPTTAGTRSHLKRTIAGILHSLASSSFIDRIRDILRFLDYEQKLEIVWYPRYKKSLFTQNLTTEKFHNFFRDLKGSTSSPSLPYSVFQYNKIENDSGRIDAVVNLLNKIAPHLQKVSNTSRATYFIFDIFGTALTMEEITNLETLYVLNILSEPSLSLQKKGTGFAFAESSSGEYHILASMIGMLTRLQSQSLVLIDEPEISLHPSWQMRYVDFLKKTFADFPDCHFVIATHSHFLVSDLAKDTSALIHMTIDDKIRGTLVPWNTFGWSAEQVLLDVFHVPTTRNYFVAERIGAILDLIAKPDRDEEEINRKVNELRETDLVNLPSDDPLKDVVKKLLEKYASR